VTILGGSNNFLQVTGRPIAEVGISHEACWHRRILCVFLGSHPPSRMNLFLQTLKMKAVKLPDRLGKLWFVTAASESSRAEVASSALTASPLVQGARPTSGAASSGRCPVAARVLDEGQDKGGRWGHQRTRCLSDDAVIAAAAGAAAVGAAAGAAAAGAAAGIERPDETRDMTAATGDAEAAQREGAEHLEHTAAVDAEWVSGKSAGRRSRPPSWIRRRLARERSRAHPPAAGLGDATKCPDEPHGGAVDPTVDSAAAAAGKDDGVFRDDEARVGDWEDHPATQVLCRSPMAVWDFDSYLGDAPLSEQLCSPPSPSMTQLAGGGAPSSSQRSRLGLASPSAGVTEYETAASAPTLNDQAAGVGRLLVAETTLAGGVITSGSAGREERLPRRRNRGSSRLRPSVAPAPAPALGTVVPALGTVVPAPGTVVGGESIPSADRSSSLAAVDRAATAPRGEAQIWPPVPRFPPPSRPVGFVPPSRRELPRASIFYSVCQRRVTGLPAKCV
jgi:hypothetical protein